MARLAGQSGFSQIYFIGEDHDSFAKGLAEAGFKGETFIQPDFTVSMGQKLALSVQGGDIIVIKGSRGAKTERFVPFLRPIKWQSK